MNDRYTKELELNDESQSILEKAGESLEEKPEEAEEVKAEQATEEEEKPVEEPQIDESQDENILAERIKGADFATEAGWEPKEFYETVTITTDLGEMSLSEAADKIDSMSKELETVTTQQTPQVQPAVFSQESPEARDLRAKAKYLQDQYHNTNWSQVQDAPSMRIEYKDQIEGLMAQAEDAQHKYDQQRQEMLTEHLAKVEKQLETHIPEWKSKRVAGQEKAAIGRFLMSEYGFDGQRLVNLQYDDVSQRITRDLWLARKKLDEIKQGVKKIGKVQKHLSPSARTEAKKPGLEDVAASIRNAKTRAEKQRLRTTAEW